MSNLAHRRVCLVAVIACFLCSPAYSADTNAKLKMNEPAKTPLNSTVKVAVPPAKAPTVSAPTLPTPGGLAPKDFAQIQQMRDAKQLKEASEAMRLGGLGAAPVGAGPADLLGTDLNRPGNRFDQFGKAPNPQNNGRNPSNDPFGGVPQPTLPNNQDHAPRGSIGGAKAPTDLKSIVKGVNRQDGWDRAHGGLSGERTSFSQDRQSGNNTTTRERGYSDGSTITEHVTQRPDGSSTTQTTYVDVPRNRVDTVYVNRDPQGNVDKTVLDPAPIPDVAAPDTAGGTNRIQDGESYSGGGSNLRNCNPFTGICFGTGPRSPNQVNPGPEGTTSSPAAPPVQIDRRLLVTNPNPNAQGNGNTETRLRDARNPVNQVDPPNPRGGDAPRP